jgi:hypothetical protein
MLISTRTLPDHYKLLHEINLAKNKTLLVSLNIMAVLFLIFTSWLLFTFLTWIRPGLVSGTLSFSMDVASLGKLLGFIVIAVLNIIVHELIHGFFFWLFTQSKPVFALRFTYAYAAAPDWYIPFRQYWIIGLAPFLIITAAGMLCLILLPAEWVLLTCIIIVLNASGSVGDFLIIGQLFRSSKLCLVNDSGHGVRFYEPVQ